MTVTRLKFTPAVALRPLIRTMGLFSAVCCCVQPSAKAQSAANWLATAPVPSRALLFGATAAAKTSGSLPVAVPVSDSSASLSEVPEAEASGSTPVSALLPDAPRPGEQHADADTATWQPTRIESLFLPKPAHGSDPAQHVADKTALTIPPGWHAQKLTAHDKAVAGVHDLYSFQTVAAWFLASGWEQLTNGSPNYGTDSGAYGVRLGAAALRGTSQNVFSEIVFAPLLHEDDRYYAEGDRHNFFHRVAYAATRTLVTRTDSGKATVNGSVLLGYAGAAALTPTYYPEINRNFKNVASSYGTGLGGAALGFLVSEFSGDALRFLHLSNAR